MKKCGLWFLTMMLAPFYAFAIDGVVLINQSSVLAAGGFPYVISSSGAYKLSGNLIVPNSSTTAIMITSSNVSVDMNGFSILGPTVCAGPNFAVTTCSPTGTGDGISTSLAANSLITVFNGNVKGMGRFGINLDGCQQCSVEKVNASHNGSIGILIGRGRLSDNTAFFNGVRGIQNAAGPLLNNYAAGNGQIGIIANCPGSVIGNVAEFNGTQGLFINGGGCVAATNTSVP
jgi:parallel beta-helix repeat protein